MINFLIKKFVKNNEDISDPSVREDYGKLAGLIGIVCNLFLFASKLIIGLIIQSVSVMADSFNNLSDSLSSIISLFSFKLSNKPADKEHPFGHGRTELIASLIVSFIILLLGYEFLKTSISKIISPADVTFNIVTIVILVLGIFVKVWLSYINLKIGKKINSGLLKATSIDARNDVIVTSVTVLSIIFTSLTNIYIDGYVGVIVALFLLYSGYSIAKDVVSQILGEGADPELAKRLKADIMAYTGVIGVHDMIVHNYGPTNIIATIHVEVPYTESLEEAHNLIDTIEKEIGLKYNIMLVIHMDPINTEDTRIMVLSKTVEEVLQTYNNNLNGHEYRIVENKSTINFIFDLEIPHKYSKKQIDEVCKNINKEVKKIDKKYECIINIETSYIL